MAIGATNVQIVTAPINATTVKTAFDACVTALGCSAQSGSYMMSSFNDGRGIAIAGVYDTV